MNVFIATRLYISWCQCPVLEGLAFLCASERLAAPPSGARYHTSGGDAQGGAGTPHLTTLQ